jgi:hypothetical protein
MSRYTFIQEDDDGNRITHEFTTEFHYEVGDRFNEFLLGCGFVFNEGERYELTQPETTSVGVAQSAWPNLYDEIDVMSWTSDQLSKTEPLYTIREPGEFQGWHDFPVNDVCPKCKLSKAIMRNSKCFDTNCGMV